jgi:hypothetical protein
MKQFHCRYIVDVYLELEYDDQSLPVHPYGEDGRGEQELADGGLSLKDHYQAVDAARG